MDKNTAQEVFNNSLKDSQFNVGPIPYHLHNGVDTAQISYNDLTDTPTSLSNVLSGMITAYGGSTAPTGYLLCDGTSYLRATYASLFTIIGTTFGAVDGTHFSVPDLRATVPAGYKSGDANFGTLGGAVGTATHTLTLAQIPSHSHGLTDGVGIYQVGTNPGPGGNANSWLNQTWTAQGGGGSHPNIQPSLTINYIIKY